VFAGEVHELANESVRRAPVGPRLEIVSRTAALDGSVVPNTA
jgi:hypothetical protein